MILICSNTKSTVANTEEDSNSDENNSLIFSNTPFEKTVFSVYPNPTNGAFYIDLKNNLSGIFTLYNLQGASLGQWEVSNGRKITLDDKTFINSIVIGLLLTSDNQLLRTKISLR